jgi:hypothetical protein
MRLPHRDRQPSLPAAVKLAKTRIPIAAGVSRDVLVPNNRQRDVLAPEFLVDCRPGRFRMLAMTTLLTGRSKQSPLQDRIGQLHRKPVYHPCGGHPAQRQTHRRGGNAYPNADLPGRQSRFM